MEKGIELYVKMHCLYAKLHTELAKVQQRQGNSAQFGKLWEFGPPQLGQKLGWGVAESCELPNIAKSWVEQLRTVESSPEVGKSLPKIASRACGGRGEEEEEQEYGCNIYLCIITCKSMCYIWFYIWIYVVCIYVYLAYAPMHFCCKPM